MRQQFQKQSGFSAIMAIVAIVGLLGLAFGAWHVWNKDKTSSGKAKTAQPPPSPTNQTKKPTDPSEDGKYLIIKEWGVRFELPEDLRGDIYYKTAGNDITKLERASFASTRLDSLLGNLSCSFKENPQIDGLSAGLLRLAPEYQPAPNFITENLDRFKTIGGYEYFTNRQASPPITCLTGQHEEFNDIEQSISNQLQSSFSKIEEIN
jgi:hypothetical protein